jgi:TIR domain
MAKAIFTSERIPELPTTSALAEKVQSETWDPTEGMQDLRLPEATRGVLEAPFKALGLSMADAEVEHPYSHVMHHVTRVDGLPKPLYLIQVDFRVVDKPTQANVDALSRIPHLVRGEAYVRIFTGHPVPPHLSFVEMLRSWFNFAVEADFVSDRQLIDFSDTHGDMQSLWTLLAFNQAPLVADTSGDTRGVAMDTRSPGPRIFVSYAHSDQEIFRRIRVHLDGLVVSENELEIWSDDRIEAGEDWRNEIEAALDAANIGLLLLSADFLASKFIKTSELPVLLDAATERGLRVFWIVVESVDVPDPIRRYQALHKEPPLGTLKSDKLEAALASVMGTLRKQLIL